MPLRLQLSTFFVLFYSVSNFAWKFGVSSFVRIENGENLWPWRISSFFSLFFFPAVQHICIRQVRRKWLRATVRVHSWDTKQENRENSVPRDWCYLVWHTMIWHPACILKKPDPARSPFSPLRNARRRAPVTFAYTGEVFREKRKEDGCVLSLIFGIGILSTLSHQSSSSAAAAAFPFWINDPF